MTYKYLLTIFLTSLSSLGAFASISMAQERPECYLIDSSGQLTDLTDICNVSQKRSPDTDTIISEVQNLIDNNNNAAEIEPLGTRPSTDNSSSVFVGDNLSLELSSVDSSSFIDNEIGVDYTAYTRSYKVAPVATVRRTLREEAFQFDTNRDSLTSILRQSRGRLPFLIYRYPNLNK